METKSQKKCSKTGLFGLAMVAVAAIPAVMFVVNLVRGQVDPELLFASAACGALGVSCICKGAMDQGASAE